MSTAVPERGSESAEILSDSSTIAAIVSHCIDDIGMAAIERAKTFQSKSSSAGFNESARFHGAPALEAPCS